LEVSEVRTYECGICGHYFDIDVERRLPRTAVVEQEHSLHPGRFDPVEVNVCDECHAEGKDQPRHPRNCRCFDCRAYRGDRAREERRDEWERSVAP